NLYIKIPGTPEGLPAIEECTFAGIPINVTLLFSAEQYQASAEAYLRGIERRVRAGLDPAIGSVGSVFVSRWDTAVADRVPAELRDRLGIAEAGLAYRAYRELLDSPRWGRLANEGARPQRLLWASTSTKNPQASDLLYVNALAAPFTINTMPENTLLGYADHGELGPLMAAGGGDAEHTLAAFDRADIDHQGVAGQLQRDGAATFDASWQSLLASIAGKREPRPDAGNGHPSHR
ncbi:MAG: transaldolase, partial [Actinomycetota bacterium]|nr:transaldolase [Actinomycetota bacterium]